MSSINASAFVFQNRLNREKVKKKKKLQPVSKWGLTCDEKDQGSVTLL